MRQFQNHHAFVLRCADERHATPFIKKQCEYGPGAYAVISRMIDTGSFFRLSPSLQGGQLARCMPVFAVRATRHSETGNFLRRVIAVFGAQPFAGDRFW
jgi:hypothetical protein